uniref:Uncharacterized protein n=1 Tax=Anguilla anguilla TaxID=7936 RepID=A0A0E9UX00_ANGAN
MKSSIHCGPPGPSLRTTWDDRNSPSAIIQNSSRHVVKISIST